MKNQWTFSTSWNLSSKLQIIFLCFISCFSFQKCVRAVHRHRESSKVWEDRRMGMNSFPLSSLPPAGSRNAIKLVFMNPPQDMAPSETCPLSFSSKAWPFIFSWVWCLFGKKKRKCKCQVFGDQICQFWRNNWQGECLQSRRQMTCCALKIWIGHFIQRKKCHSQFVKLKLGWILNPRVLQECEIICCKIF